MLEPFTILIIVTAIVIILFFFLTLPVLKIISQETTQKQPNETKLKKVETEKKTLNQIYPDKEWKHVKPKNTTAQQAYYEYIVQRLNQQIKKDGGIQGWMEKNKPSKHQTYQPFFVEVWTTQYPYLCLYSNYYQSRENKTAEELTENQGHGSCLGDPTCDVMTLISELVFQANKQAGCFTPIAQTWTFPRSKPGHTEKSLVFLGVLGNKNIPDSVGREIMIRIIFNPDPSPASFRTNWQKYM